MASEKWQAPLNEIADPFGMRKLSEDTAEVAFAEQLSTVAVAPEFAAAYRDVLLALANAAKFQMAEEADFLLAEGDAAVIDTERNVRLLNAGVDYCRGRNNAAKDSAKKNVWQKCQTHLSNWSQAFSASTESLAAALVIDKILHDNKGPISVDEALDIIRKKVGLAALETLPDIVRWYLLDIRRKYRKDIEIKAARIECPKCGSKHDEGVECEHCRRAEAALRAARKALDSKRWPEAESKAKEVQGIWRDSAEAAEIREKARAGAEEERKAADAIASANASIQAALKAEDLEMAEICLKSASVLPGFDTAKWSLKIREARTEKERRERQEKESRERIQKIADAKRRYEDAISAGAWDEAERVSRERVKLGDGSVEQYRKEISDAKKYCRDALEKSCRDALFGFEKNFPNNLDVASAALDSAEKAAEALEREARASSVLASTRRGIKAGRAKIVERKRELAIADLRQVQSLSAVGSTDGRPVVVVSWRPASAGTKAVKWQLRRREKGGDAKVCGVSVDDLSFRDETAKLGVEYEYGVIPMVEVEPEPGKKIFKANEKAEVWSAPAVCLAPLPKDALIGVGQGMDGVGGIATLQWRMPEGLQASVPHRFLLSRGDGKFTNKDVSSFNCVFEDSDVSVGATLVYTLRFELCGRDMGTAHANVVVKKVQPPSPVGKFSFRRSAQGGVLVRWEWPEGLDSCLWGVSEHEAAKPGDIARIAQRRVSKAVFDEKGGVSPVVPPNGVPCWLTVFGIRTFGDREFFSAGRSIPLRETVLEYVVETHPGGVFSKRKPAMIVMRSSTGYFPDMEIRGGKTRAEVLSRRGGRIVDRLAQESSSANVKRVVLDGKVPLGEFVRVYLVHADTENCKLIHPSEFEVR